MVLCVAVLSIAAGAAAAVAHPPTAITGGGKELGGSWHRWLHQAKVPLVDGRIRLEFRACPRHPGFAACVFSRRPRRIYIKRGLNEPRRILYHELGHVFDFLVLNGSERRRFKRIVRLEGVSWYRGRPSPAEWFADAYSLCARRGEMRGKRPRRTAYAYLPSRGRHAAACRLIEQAADKGGAPPQAPPNPPPKVVDQPPLQAPPAHLPSDTPEDCSLLENVLGCGT
jgi:hypothetical protein